MSWDRTLRILYSERHKKLSNDIRTLYFHGVQCIKHASRKSFCENTVALIKLGNNPTILKKDPFLPIIIEREIKEE